ncbi:ACP S-malonyltransferase [Flavobacteriaceae bacterium]|jgi:[acyl-carrier-protein] S-malonyltransferase|nr:ACP S-malonyltransferase [Flavobacteriaceae bacterium]MDB2696233.1 ACP S-malonyltransferase [Flavobacteriaceae bacterium]MDB4263496.1 ACP S-malonyltransferase [Flavobacteriaceae bacterium]MDB4269351.1 ACP S-malonyltransferase [Flavobacteriaceae bacterium]|tara:strand:- start:16241 stop:17119 length:879 start_codon:yes stop_codon:yes gene_type:complete
MNAFVFPGQGAQFPGMGKDLFESNTIAKKHFEQANDVLGFKITEIMFGEDALALKETKVTQPAIFLHSTILSKVMGERFAPQMVAGHSLGEFSSLVAAGVLSFEDGLQLVHERALAMQAACDDVPGTMAAIIGLEDQVVESICEKTPGIVIAANYNCPGQLVISGSQEAVKNACTAFTEAGARRALVLPVGGAFHSPLMEPAKKRLAKAIENTNFQAPSCPVYQNVTALGTSDPEVIKSNLVAQLTAPVKWTQSVQQMIADGATHFTEVGPGKVLQGLVKKIDRNMETESGT